MNRVTRVDIKDNGLPLMFRSEETFLTDAVIYCNRCAEETGEMHVIFCDESGKYICRHICQPYDKAWRLVYSANPYMGDGN